MAKLKVYCMGCGKPAEYTMEKPKFCQSCGSPFDKKTNALSISKKTEAEHETEESEEEERIPNIEKLDFDVVIYETKATSIKDLAQYSMNAGEPEERITPEVGQISTKDFLEQFRKEAGTLRNKNDPRE